MNRFAKPHEKLTNQDWDDVCEHADKMMEYARKMKREALCHDSSEKKFSWRMFETELEGVGYEHDNITIRLGLASGLRYTPMSAWQWEQVVKESEAIISAAQRMGEVATRGLRTITNTANKLADMPAAAEDNNSLECVDQARKIVESQRVLGRCLPEIPF